MTLPVGGYSVPSSSHMVTWTVVATAVAFMKPRLVRQVGNDAPSALNARTPTTSVTPPAGTASLSDVAAKN